MGIQSSKEGPRLHYLINLRDRQACLQAIQHGVDLNLVDQSGRSPLRTALDQGDAEIFLALVTARAEMHPPLTMGLTPLHVAVTLGHYALAKMMLRDYRTFPGLRNARDAVGRTPLHVAVQADNPEMVALLLKYNCNPLLKDQSGLTPKDLAMRSRSPLALEIIDQLSIEDVMQKQANKSICEQAVDRLPSRNSPLTLDPASRGASSHGSKSTLKSQATEPQPPTTELEPVSFETIMNLEEEIKQNCIPIIHGSEIQFEEIINRGSSCEVFKGHWRGCEVAIKKFKEEYKQNAKELSKFVKEMQTLAHVRHPNLILLMGICIDLSNLCLITEYVPNMSLFYALHSNSYSENKAKKLSLLERFSISVQICKGLAYLHAASPPIVHRDLKPENCLLDYSLNVKIADFGLARPLTCFTSEEAMTTTCIGTTRFMAPELFEKEKISDIGVEVDIWALGCILVELFSNKRPWDYISSTNANCIYYEVSARQIFKKKPLPVPDSIPVEVRGIIQCCCQYAPKRRPSASEVLDQLQIIRQRYE